MYVIEAAPANAGYYLVWCPMKRKRTCSILCMTVCYDFTLTGAAAKEHRSKCPIWKGVLAVRDGFFELPVSEVRMTEELTKAQEAAFDNLITEGGEDAWIPAKSVGHPQSILALERRHVVQTKDIEGEVHVALAGVLLDEEVADAAGPEAEEDRDDSPPDAQDVDTSD
jgi:hypothetical protein